MKHEEEADTRVVVKSEEKSVGTKGKRPKKDLTTAKELTTELPEGRQSPNHRLNLLTNLTYDL